jgi:hypothetical protein
VSFVNRPLLVVGALLGLGAAVAFSAGALVMGGIAVLVALISAFKAIRNYRRRPWGAEMSADERARWGSRLVFEPTCLRPGCGGPVVEYRNNQMPLEVRPFTASPVDPAVPDFYTQGKAGCRRCRLEYMYSIAHGGLSLQTFDQAMRAGFSPLNG